jgi:DNA modification methylase
MPQEITTVPIGDLEPHPANPRQGDVGLIHSLIEENGWYGVIVAQRSSGRILAGNHRWRAAKAAGLVELPVAYLDVDDDRAERILLADNRSNDLASYDDHALADLLQSLTATTNGLVGTGWDGDDLDTLLRDLNGDQPTDDDDHDSVVAERAQERWQVEPGDIWAAGDHRIICGDSSHEAILDAVRTPDAILTDPPYGIHLDTDYAPQTNLAVAKTYPRVENDDQPFDAAHLRQRFLGAAEQFWFGANYYRRTLSSDDLDGSWLVWDKRPTAWDSNGDDWTGSGFELIWSAQPHQQRVLRHSYAGFVGRNQFTRAHPTEKPIRLLSDILTRWTQPGHVTLDPFSGSGTTILACHDTNRVGIGIELDPAYVAVTLERLASLGLTPERTDG